MPFSDDLIHDLDEEMEVYRLVRTLDQADPEWLRSFMSRHALGLPPRPPMDLHPMLMHGVSVSRDFEKLRADGLRVRQRRPELGGGIARLVLGPLGEVRVAEWGAPGHLTIWAEPVMLAAAVADTVSL